MNGAPEDAAADSVLTRSMLAVSGRSGEGTKTLQLGQTVAMNATGAFALKDAPFTLTADGWTTTATDYCCASVDTFSLSVTSPYLSTYDAASLYDEHGLLADVLFARGNFSVGQTVDLTLDHVFAQVTVRVDETLRPLLTSLVLDVPARVTALQPATGQFTLDVTQPVTAILTADGAETYTFIVPSGQPLALRLTATLQSGRTVTSTIHPHALATHHTYTYSLMDAASAQGIHDADEWKAFVHLYNTDRQAAIAQYGVEENGIAVFRLLNDIDFTDADMTDFASLGTAEQPFGDVLDGLEHTLRHLTLPDDCAGLIGQTSGQCVVRHLKVEDGTLQITKTDATGTYGLLSALMKGRMEHCVLTNCTVKAETNEKHSIGLFAGSLQQGTLVNCSAEGCTVRKGRFAGGVGVMAASAVVNCRFSEMTVYNPMYGGALCGYASCSSSAPGRLLNCWIHNINMTMGSKSMVGSVAGYAKEVSVENCAFREGTETVLFGKQGSDIVLSHCYSYDTSLNVADTDEEWAGTPVVQRMNYWVETQGYLYDGTGLLTWSATPSTLTLAD
jgi:hypothetical protein